MSREIPEWEGAYDDQAIPARVKLRIWTRCEGKCAITGRKLRPGDEYDFDHILPLIMGGKHAESNLQLVSRQAHREKTRQDVDMKAKADRVAKKHLGLWPKSRGFDTTKTRGFDGKVRARKART